MINLSEDISEKFQSLLEKALSRENTKMGNIQVFNSESESLSIIAQKGFKEDFLEHFKVVKAFDTTACGRAVGVKSPLIIGDVLQDIAFTPHRELAKDAGFRSVKSVPILGKGNKVLGVISTHYEEPKWSWDINIIDDVVKELANLLQSNIKVSL